MKKTEKQQNALKGVMLPFEKFGCLRNLPVDETGEIIQTVLAYGMTGTRPEFRDKFQQRYYDTFLEPITEQIASAEKRAHQCREAAQLRADTLKEAKKIIAMQIREAKSAKNTVNAQGSINSDAVIEDLSFTHFISLGLKRDTGTYNGELLWNDMSDDDKRYAITYVTQNIASDALKRNTQYASQFLTSNVWKPQG